MAKLVSRGLLTVLVAAAVSLTNSPVHSAKGKSERLISDLKALFAKPELLQRWGASGKPIGSRQNAKTGKRFGMHRGAVRTVLVSANGNMLATGGADRTVRLWRYDDKSKEWQPQGTRIPGQLKAMSSDGRVIVTLLFDKGLVQIWGPDGGKLGEASMGTKVALPPIAISGNGKRIAVGGRNGKIRTLNPNGKWFAESFHEHEGPVTGISISPDGNLIVSVGKDRVPKIWKSDGTFIANLDVGLREYFRSVIATNSGIVTFEYKGTIRLWRKDGSSTGSVVQIPGVIYGGRGTGQNLVPVGGDVIAVTDKDYVVHLLHLDRNKISRSRKFRVGKINSIATARSGALIATADDDGAVSIWDAGMNLQSALANAHRGMIAAVAATGDVIVTAGRDGTVRLWSKEGSAITPSLTGHTGPINAVAISSRADLIASGGTDGTIRLWSRDGRPIGKPLLGHRGPVTAVVVSPSGNLVVSGGADRSIRLWRRDGTSIRILSNTHKWEVNSVAISADGSVFASAGSGGAVRLWKSDGTLIWEKRPQRKPNSLLGHWGWVKGVSVSRAGELVVSGGLDTLLRFWKRDGSVAAKPLMGHKGWISTVFVSNDGRLLASNGKDGAIRIWTLNALDLKTKNSKDVLAVSKSQFAPLQVLRRNGKGFSTFAMAASGDYFVNIAGLSVGIIEPIPFPKTLSKDGKTLNPKSITRNNAETKARAMLDYLGDPEPKTILAESKAKIEAILDRKSIR